jgi:hypothetical protein
MNLEIYEAKISQMGFADLKAMKELQDANYSEILRGTELEEDRINLLEEQTVFNQVIDRVISNKLNHIHESIIKV